MREMTVSSTDLDLSSFYKDNGACLKQGFSSNSLSFFLIISGLKTYKLWNTRIFSSFIEF